MNGLHYQSAQVHPSGARVWRHPPLDTRPQPRLSCKSRGRARPLRGPDHKPGPLQSHRPHTQPSSAVAFAMPAAGRQSLNACNCSSVRAWETRIPRYSCKCAASHELSQIVRHRPHVGPARTVRPQPRVGAVYALQHQLVQRYLHGLQLHRYRLARKIVRGQPSTFFAGTGGGVCKTRRGIGSSNASSSAASTASSF